MMPLLRTPAQNASPEKLSRSIKKFLDESWRAIARQTRRRILKRCFATGAPPVLMVESRTYGHTGPAGDGVVADLSGRGDQICPCAVGCGQNLRSVYQTWLSKFDG